MDEARSRARVMLAAIRDGSDAQAALPSDILFEAVADEVFRRYARNWKSSTLKVNQGYYRKQILPWFQGRPITDIDAQDVKRWFASLHETPVAADRPLPILSVIMRQAEIYGYRPEGTNPCVGIRRYRRQGRERFLSTTEIRRLGEVLARHEADYPQPTVIIRLLLLTGCRKGEIVSLKWRFYREGKLFLPDSKTGPRRVFLNAQARAILERQPRSEGTYVFPSPLDPGRPLSSDLPLWYTVRKRVGIEDVRLHDLRHTLASHAVLQGIPLPVVSRLLGHKRPSMTLRYAHVSDRETEAAAERIGAAIARKLSGREVS
ncbi:MAG: site-specific integrase [Alphaproteobacteria bacterium]|nr:site-specific integrase [Alphaproteobacteria bacterium]